MNYSTDKIIQSKFINELPNNILKNLCLISLPPTELGDEYGQPFGSFYVRSSRVFGDIDLMQQYVGCCSVDEVVKDVKDTIIKIVKNVQNSSCKFVSEIKIGLDNRFQFNIGKLNNGIYKPSDQLYSKMTQLIMQNLLSQKELNILHYILSKPNKDGNDFDVIYNMFREKYILRWTADDVLRGKKMQNNKVFNIEDSLREETPFKIDVQFIDDDNKFLEITNFMAIAYKDGDDSFIPINMDFRVNLDPENLLDVIEQLYYSDWYYNPFKMVKRMFSFLRHLYRFNRNDVMEQQFLTKYEVSDYIQKINKILQSTINILYSVNSELEAMMLIVEKNKPDKKCIEKMNKRLDMLKTPISNVLELENSEVELITKGFDALIKEKSVNKFIEGIKELRKFLKNITNKWTIDYLNKVGMNPPPPELMRLDPIYDREIIRTPDCSPENPLKKLEDHISGGSFNLKSLAKSIFQKLANKYRAKYCNNKTRPLLKGEYHWGCHNFTGPGTKISLDYIRDTEPINDIDACSRQHDIDYYEAISKEMDPEIRRRLLRQADVKVMQCYDKYPNQNGYRVAKLGINSKMKLEDSLPIIARSLFGPISAAGRLSNLDSGYQEGYDEEDFDEGSIFRELS
jgi:hypothetical protein